MSENERVQCLHPCGECGGLQPHRLVVRRGFRPRIECMTHVQGKGE